jgi:predicted XRE-type DNA-binding protein
MSDERYASVWDAIENTPAEAENLKLRSALMVAETSPLEASNVSAYGNLPCFTKITSHFSV